MDKLRTEGVIVSAFAFKDYDRIITLFTPEAGLIKLVVKGAFSAKQGKGNSTAPLTHVETIYTEGRGELCSCREINVLNHFLGLRQQLLTLQAACNILQAIAATQQPGKSSPGLYQLLIAYLYQLQTATDPRAITASFQLKTLRHEGILNLDEWETPDGTLMLRADERRLVEHLALCRNFGALAATIIDNGLAAKIAALFWSACDLSPLS
jgi:DNA repair protein RecO